MAVFEDLHWADEATLQLLAHLVQAVAGMPLMMIGTYRDGDVNAESPFAAAFENWIRDRTAARLTLRRFGPEGVAALLQALCGRTPPAALVSTVFEETDGNPFFVEEVFRHLLEEGRLFDPEGAWREAWPAGDLRVPPEVRLVIARRLARLTEAARCVLTTAAVIGRWFDPGLLEDLEGAAALEALEQAERASLVEAERRGYEVRYRFVHELVRQTLAESLSLPRRQRLHARIAGAVERLHQGALDRHAPALAHHLYEAAAAGDPEKAIHYLTLAARQAATGAAHEEALTLVDKALLLAVGARDPRTAQLHATRAAALRSLGRMEEATEAYQCAASALLEAGLPGRAAEAHFHIGYIQLWRGSAACLDSMDRAVGLVAGQPSPLLHRFLLSKSMALGAKGRMQESLATLAEAKRIEAALPEPPADGFSSMLETRIWYQNVRLDRAWRCGREAWDRFRRAADPWGEVEVFEPLSAALFMGRPAETEALLPGFLSQAERIGHQNACWVYRMMRTGIAMARGDLREAERAAREVHDFAESISSGWKHTNCFVSGVVAHYRGQLEEALAWTRAGLEVEPETFLAGLLSGSLFLTLAALDDAGAEAALQAARRRLPDPGRPLSMGSSGCLAMVIEGLALLGRREEAAALGAAAEHVVAEGPWCLHPQQQFRTAAGIASAAAGDWSRAEQHHRTAIHQADTAPYRIAQPAARYWYAAMLAERGGPGDRQRARDLRAEALHLYESLGSLGTPDGWPAGWRRSRPARGATGRA